VSLINPEGNSVPAATAATAAMAATAALEVATAALLLGSGKSSSSGEAVGKREWCFKLVSGTGNLVLQVRSVSSSHYLVTEFLVRSRSLSLSLSLRCSRLTPLSLLAAAACSAACCCLLLLAAACCCCCCCCRASPGRTCSRGRPRCTTRSRWRTVAATSSSRSGSGWRRRMRRCASRRCLL
jgi:hypothetical protein